MKEEQAQMHKNIHNLIGDFSKDMLSKVKEFTQIQAELMEFRIFASLNPKPEEVKRIAKSHKKYQKEDWEALLKKHKGNEEKAFNALYD